MKLRCSNFLKRYATIENYNKNEVIYTFGEDCQEIYLIVKGEVSLEMTIDYDNL